MTFPSPSCPSADVRFSTGSSRTSGRSTRSTRPTWSRTAALPAEFAAWAEAHGVVVHDDGTSTNEDRLGAIGDLKYVLDRAGIDDDVLVDRRRQPVRLQAGRLRALLAHPSRHQRRRRLRLRGSRARRRLRHRRARRRRSDHVLRREARRPAVDTRCDRHLSLLTAPAAADRRLPRRRKRARPGRQPGRMALPSPARCTATASRASGSTSEIARSCSRPTTGRGGCKGCRSAPSTRSTSERRRLVAVRDCRSGPRTIGGAPTTGSRTLRLARGRFRTEPGGRQRAWRAHRSGRERRRP